LVVGSITYVIAIEVIPDFFLLMEVETLEENRITTGAVVVRVEDSW